MVPSFGEGLAKDLADFGGKGQPPDHPELLDTLAVRLIEQLIKPLLREILISRTYRQTSSPSKGHGTFQIAQRLPAEAVRDNALAISGILTRDIGGASVKPHQPAVIIASTSRPVATRLTLARRSGVADFMYTGNVVLHPMMRAFDAPREIRQAAKVKYPNFSCTPQRPYFCRGSSCILNASYQKVVQVDKRLQYAFHRAVSRKPDRHELHTLNDFIEKEGGQDSEDAWFQLARVLLNLSEAYTRL